LLVRIFDEQCEVVESESKAVHVRIPEEMPCDNVLRAEQMIHQRGIEGVRVLMGLLHLAHRHSSESIEEACALAASHGAYRLRTIRELLKRRGGKQERFEFLDEHAIIRPLTDYGKLVQRSFGKE
jgi:hypothetical protein